MQTTVHLQGYVRRYLQTTCMLLELCRMTKIATLLDSASFCTLVGLGFTAY